MSCACCCSKSGYGAPFLHGCVGSWHWLGSLSCLTSRHRRLLGQITVAFEAWGLAIWLVQWDPLKSTQCSPSESSCPHLDLLLRSSDMLAWSGLCLGRRRRTSPAHSSFDCRRFFPCSTCACRSLPENRNVCLKSCVPHSSSPKLCLPPHGKVPQYLAYWRHRPSCPHKDAPSCRMTSGRTFCTLSPKVCGWTAVCPFSVWWSLSGCTQQVPKWVELIQGNLPM